MNVFGLDPDQKVKPKLLTYGAVKNELLVLFCSVGKPPKWKHGFILKINRKQEVAFYAESLT